MNQQQTFNLHKFKPENIKSSDLFMIIGLQNTGKSTLIKDLLFKSSQLPFGRVFHYEEYRHFYKDFIPSILVENEFNKKNIKMVYEEKKRLYKEKRDGKEVDNRSFIIFDNCLYMDREEENPYFLKLVERKELYQNLIFITSLSLYGSPLILKNNIDYLFIYRNPFIKQRQRIYEKYGKFIPNFQMFNDIFEQCTEKDYECLVIHLSNPSTNWMDKIFWYRADVLENIKLCERKWWRESKVYKKIKDKDIKENYLKTMNQIDEFDLR